MTKFEKELIKAANNLNRSSEKMKVVAVYTEVWKGLSFNTKSNFNTYIKREDARINCFDDNKDQIEICSNYNLSFPVKIGSIKELDACMGMFWATLRVDEENDREENDY